MPCACHPLSPLPLPPLLLAYSYPAHRHLSDRSASTFSGLHVTLARASRCVSRGTAGGHMFRSKAARMKLIYRIVLYDRLQIRFVCFGPQFCHRTRPDELPLLLQPHNWPRVRCTSFPQLCDNQSTLPSHWSINSVNPGTRKKDPPPRTGWCRGVGTSWGCLFCNWICGEVSTARVRFRETIVHLTSDANGGCFKNGTFF